MNADIRLRRFTGATGVAWVVVTGTGVALFSAAGSPPSFNDAGRYAHFTSASAGLFVADAFTTGVSAALLVGFAVGLRAILDEILVLAFGLVVAAMLCVVGALELATVGVSTSSSYQAMTAPLWLMTQSAIVFLYFPTAGWFIAVGNAVRRTGAMPRWTGWLSTGAAALVAISSLAVFGGTGALGPLGLAQVLVGFVPSALMFLTIGLVLLRHPKASPQVA